ncbi:MAG: glycerophosphodiester phosphodiesterase family protein [Pseudomonadota bacterium]
MAADVTIPRPEAPAAVIAHRGASGTAPENTAAAFRQAAALGARWVEFDVTLMACGTPVVLHDATLARTTGHNLVARSLTVEALEGLDAGGWFDPTFAGEPVPRLDETLALLAALRLGFNLELKPHGASGQTGEAVARVLAATRPGPAMTVSSFDHDALAAFRAQLPSVPVAVLYRAPAEDWRETAWTLRAEALHLEYREATPELVAEAHEAGLALRVFTANDPAHVAPLRAAGLDAVVTDFPERFLRDPDWGG